MPHPTLSDGLKGYQVCGNCGTEAVVKVEDLVGAALALEEEVENLTDELSTLRDDFEQLKEQFMGATDRLRNIGSLR